MHRMVIQIRNAADWAPCAATSRYTSRIWNQSSANGVMWVDVILVVVGASHDDVAAKRFRDDHARTRCGSLGIAIYYPVLGAV